MRVPSRSKTIKEKLRFDFRLSPQRLKPDSFHNVMYGLKAIPFRTLDFPQLVKPCTVAPTRFASPVRQPNAHRPSAPVPGQVSHLHQHPWKRLGAAGQRRTE